MKKLLAVLALLLFASGAVAAPNGNPAAVDGCSYPAATITLSTGQNSSFACDSSGNLLVGASLGSHVDGWNVTEGTTGDSPYVGSGSASIVAILKSIYSGVANVAPANTAVTTAQPALAVSLAPASNGVVTPGTAGSPSAQVLSIQGVSGGTPVPVSSSPLTSDPCTNNAKSSVAIALASATTTQLIALSGSTVVYVCHFSLTIAPSATTADSIKFETGTGTTCGSNTAALTGTYGGGDLTTAAPPVVVTAGEGGFMLFATPAGYALCAVPAGGTVNIQGVLSYVQL